MDKDPHLAQFYVRCPPATCYRVCSRQLYHPRCPQSINIDGAIVPRDQLADPTLRTAERYLMWDHIETPWVALFNKLAPALRRAKLLQSQGLGAVYITIIDTYYTSGRELLDAHALAQAAGFTEGNPNRRRRLENHRAEYLFYGSIPAPSILMTIPAMGTAGEFEVHLGRMALPGSFHLQLLRRSGEKIEDTVMRAIEHRGLERDEDWDHVKLLQVMHALCVARYD